MAVRLRRSDFEEDPFAQDSVSPSRLPVLDEILGPKCFGRRIRKSHRPGLKKIIKRTLVYTCMKNVHVFLLLNNIAQTRHGAKTEQLRR